VILFHLVLEKYSTQLVCFNAANAEMKKILDESKSYIRLIESEEIRTNIDSPVLFDRPLMITAPHIWG